MSLIRLCLITYLAIGKVSAVNVQYDVDAILSDRTCAATDMSFTATTPSKISCIVRCEEEPSCNSLFYHHDDMLCNGCTEWYASPSGLPSVVGTLYFRNPALRPSTTTVTTVTTGSSVTGMYGQSCSYHSQCSVSPGLNCRNHVCDCAHAGFSYNPLTGECTDGCTNYGSTYQHYPAKKMSTPNIWCRIVFSQSGCLDLCSAESQCRSVNFLIGGLQCCLKYSTPYTHPSDYHNNIGLEDLYIRNCREY